MPIANILLIPAYEIGKVLATAKGSVMHSLSLGVRLLLLSGHFS